MSAGRAALVIALAAALLSTAACRGKGRGVRDAAPVPFAEAREPIPLRAPAVAVFHGDFDGDTRQRELLVIHPSEPWAEVLANNLGGSFRSEGRTVDLRALLPPGSTLVIRQADLFDVDGDGEQDLALLDDTTGRVLLLTGDGRGGFAFTHSLLPPWNAGETGRVVGFCRGSFNRDLDADFAVATPAQAHLYLRAVGRPDWERNRRAIDLGSGVEHLLGGDLLRQGVDVLVAVGSEGASLIRRNANGVFLRDDSHHIEITDAAAPSVADLNGDSFADFLFPRTERGQVAIWLTDVDREWVANDPGAVDVPFPTAVGVSDVTADGLPDLLVASSNIAGRPAVVVIPQRAEDG